MLRASALPSRFPCCFKANSPPDPNQAAIAGIEQDVSNFPNEWMVNALSQMGGKATIGGNQYDFTGLGNADVSGKVSDQMAQALLDIQNNYGSAYIQQRLADLKQSDPTGYAARQQLFDKITSDAEANPDRPMATELQGQVNDMLKNSGQLDEQGKQQVEQGVRAGQVSKGIYLGNAPASQEASAVVGAADNLKAQQQGAAQSYLNAGISPEDVQYRRIQQSLSNLGAFVNGTTPEAQFGSLSGAQNGAAPFNPVNYSTPASLMPMNGAAQTGINFQNSVYQTNQSQANPWLTGLNLGISGVNTAYNSGVFNSTPAAPSFSNNAAAGLNYNNFNTLYTPQTNSSMMAYGNPPPPTASTSSSFYTPLTL